MVTGERIRGARGAGGADWGPRRDRRLGSLFPAEGPLHPGPVVEYRVYRVG